MMKPAQGPTEFQYFMDNFFPKNLNQSERLEKQYYKAVDLLIHKPEGDAIKAKKIDLTLIIKKRLDLESIEFALRKKYAFNEVSQRLHILFYLTECKPEFYAHYINEKTSFIKGFTLLAIFTLRSIGKLIKGRILIRRYKIA